MHFGLSECKRDKAGKKHALKFLSSAFCEGGSMERNMLQVQEIRLHTCQNGLPLFNYLHVYL